jgi:hypothetical protein
LFNSSRAFSISAIEVCISPLSFFNLEYFDLDSLSSFLKASSFSENSFVKSDSLCLNELVSSSSLFLQASLSSLSLVAQDFSSSWYFALVTQLIKKKKDK